MAGIVLYFVKQNNARRVLDTDFEKEGHVWRIGRARDVDVNFPQPLVSKYHAQIRCLLSDEGARWEVRDTNSTNGTFLNGKRIVENVWYPIIDGDILVFGFSDNVIKLSFDDDETKSLTELDLEESPDTIAKTCTPPPASDVNRPTRSTWQGEIADELNEVSLPRLLIYAVIGIITLTIVLIFWH